MSSRRPVFLLCLILGLSAAPGTRAGIDFDIAAPLFGPAGEVTSPVASYQFGVAVAVDGDQVAIGAPRPTSGLPAAAAGVFVYRRSGATHTLLQQIAEPAGTARDFGRGLALDGHTLVVYTSDASLDGRVRIYERSADGEPFAFVQQLESSASADGVVARGGRVILTNSSLGTVRGCGGLAWFERSGPDPAPWTVGADLPCPDGTAFANRSANFVAYDGATLAVLVTSPTFPSTRQLLLFARTPQGWSFEADLDLGAGFVTGALAVDGHTAVVGWFDSFSNDPGSARVFTRNGALWIEGPRLSVPGVPAGERFGSGVAIRGDSLAIASASRLHLFQPFGGGFQDVRSYTLDAADNAGLGFGDTTLYVAKRNDGSDSLAVTGIQTFDESLADESAVLGYVEPRLWVPAAQDAGTDPSSAALRWVHELYRSEAGGTPFAAFDELESLYTVADHARVLRAEDYLERAALAAGDPDGPAARALIQSIADRSEAAHLIAQNRMSVVSAVRLGLTAPPPCDLPGQVLPPVIDREICVLERALESFRFALRGGLDFQTAASGRGLWDLLADDFGAAPIDGLPWGYALFQRSQPATTQRTATYRDPGSGDFVPVADDAGAPSTHPQVLLLLDMLADAAEAERRLAELYAARGDDALAATQIADGQGSLLALGQTLLGVFPDLESEVGADAGVREAIESLRHSLTALGEAAQRVRSGVNLLGFDSDFLIFMAPVAGVSSFDSYDRMRDFVSAPGRPLDDATQALLGPGGAVESYAGYQGRRDELEAQLLRLETSVGNRLADIVGAHPSDAAAYAAAQADPRAAGDTGLVFQQIQAIEAAALRVARNRVEADNVRRRIAIERERRNATQDAILRFSDRQVTLTREIGDLEAAQAGAEAAAEFLTGLATNPFAVFGGLIGAAANTATQLSTELLIADKEAQKERLAALEQVELEGIDSAAQVKTWLLELNTLAVDSQEAVLGMQQEATRLKSLIDETSRLETQLREARASLAGRYFADPIHRLRAEGDLHRAQVTFEQAWTWMFYLVRALEYKWNVPFSWDEVRPDGVRTWTTESLFALRNAEELADFRRVLEDFDEQRAAFVVFSDPKLDVISLKEDILGYIDGVDGNGDPLLYEHPDPARSDRVSADEAFAGYLATLPRDSFGDRFVRFSTAREFESTQLFLPSTTLDKIDRVIVALPGNHGRLTSGGFLQYAGTSWIRTPSTPLPGPRPDRQPDELVSYSTRNWGVDIASGQLVAEDGLEVSAQLLLDRAPPATCSEPGVDWINEFKERSVAASAWQLALPDRALDRAEDIELYICHRWTSRPRR